MTLEEKAQQTITSSAAAIPRLGVSQYNYWSEGLHGVARSGNATSFPHGLGIASTWNTDLVQEMGDAISDEARGYSNEKGKGLSYCLLRSIWHAIPDGAERKKAMVKTSS